MIIASLIPKKIAGFGFYRNFAAKSMQKLRIYRLILCLLFALLTIVGKAQRLHDQYYQVCLKLPTDSLLARGKAHLGNCQYQQALICFTVASDRLDCLQASTLLVVRKWLSGKEEPFEIPNHL